MITPHTCYCVGPQRGEPYCPCQMESLGIVMRNGRWVQPERDLGPARTVDTLRSTFGWTMSRGDE